MNDDNDSTGLTHCPIGSLLTGRKMPDKLTIGHLRETERVDLNQTLSGGHIGSIAESQRIAKEACTELLIDAFAAKDKTLIRQVLSQQNILDNIHQNYSHNRHRKND